MLVLHKDSHTDHVPPAVLEYVLERFKDKNEFFIEKFELPPEVPDLECGLYGPLMGDPPVPEDEVSYVVRPGRKWATRTVDRPKRPTRLCTVIGGRLDEIPCVLYTVYGGVPAKREPGSVVLAPENVRKESVEFWSTHALAR